VLLLFLEKLTSGLVKELYNAQVFGTSYTFHVIDQMLCAARVHNEAIYPYPCVQIISSKKVLTRDRCYVPSTILNFDTIISPATPHQQYPLSDPANPLLEAYRFRPQEDLGGNNISEFIPRAADGLVDLAQYLRDNPAQPLVPAGADVPTLTLGTDYNLVDDTPSGANEGGQCSICLAVCVAIYSAVLMLIHICF
jgi:hypothetical protein